MTWQLANSRLWPDSVGVFTCIVDFTGLPKYDFFFFFCPEGFPYCDIPNLPTCSPWMGVILGLLTPNCVHCNNVPQLLLLIFLLSKETGQSGWLMGQLSMKKPAGVLGGSSAVEWADPGMSSWFWISSSGRCPQERRKPVHINPDPSWWPNLKWSLELGLKSRRHCMQTSIKEWCQNYQLRTRCL